MSKKFKDFETTPNDDFDVGFKVPETKTVLGGIDEALRKQSELFKAHQDQNEKEEQDEKEGKKRPVRKPKRGGQICMCGNPACGIGEMRQLSE